MQIIHTTNKHIIAVFDDQSLAFVHKGIIVKNFLLIMIYSLMPLFLEILEEVENTTYRYKA